MCDEETTIHEIQIAVCKYYGVGFNELLSPRRLPRLVKARHVAMHLARDLTTASLPEIGRAFNRDHSTVIYAINHIDDQAQVDIRCILAQFKKLRQDEAYNSLWF